MKTLKLMQLGMSARLTISKRLRIMSLVIHSA